MFYAEALELLHIVLLSNQFLENDSKELVWKIKELKLRVEENAKTFLDPKLMKDLGAEQKLMGESAQI